MTSLITNSRAKCARLCARLHDLQYRQGYRPAGRSEELEFGDLIHRCLAAWWTKSVPGVDIEERLVDMLAVLEAEQMDPYARMRAMVMLNGYHARWAGERLWAVSVECGFSAPLINPATGAESKLWRIAGKIDVVVIDENGDTWLMEHKTSSEDVTPGSTYHRRLRMDSQVSIYFDGARSLGHNVRGCIYDVLGKPSQRPSQTSLLDDLGVKIVLDANGERVRTQQGKWRQTGDTAQGFVLQTRDETPEEYCARLVEAVTAKPEEFYVRAEVVRLESELDDARADLWQQAQRIREDERLHRAPRNPDACTMYGRICSFFDVCSGAADLSDERLFRRSSDVHPELAGVVEVNASDSKEESP